MDVAKPTPAIFAAAMIGSIVEWYDLFVYGSLVVVLSSVFFPANGTVPPILPAIGAFVAGAAVRPLGGAVFGRFGDLIGRKFAFVLTTIVMGVGSILIGLLPTFQQIGVLAPIALVLLRILQGLALGGEYGGGVIYIAENTSDRNRGHWTSFAQAASTVGLLLASSVAILTRLLLGNVAFMNWGWRIPFLGASVLLVIALVIRWRLFETPLFLILKRNKKTSKSPLSETLRYNSNLRRVFLALMIVSGASVVWHTAQFYTAIFMQNTLKIDFLATGMVTVIALALGAPFYVIFGHLSDRVGRLKVMLAGTALGGICFYPTYYALNLYSHPVNIPVLTGLLFIQILFSAMCYGPMGAFLVEYFPARIRYTSMSISHGVGTGDVGDGTLLIAPVLVLVIGNIYAGLIWSTMAPILVSIFGAWLVKETNETRIWSETEGNQNEHSRLEGE
jgi:MFS family permease